MTEAFQQHHLPKPCEYCGGSAGYSPIDEMNRHEADVYFCQRCKAEYIYFRRTEFLANTSLYVEINGKTYRWSHNRGIGQLWFIEKPGEPGVRRNDGIKLVRTFSPGVGESVPQITPSNIEEKVRTILVFL